MRRFPFISLLLLVVALLASVWIGNETAEYCTFGFGGFQCNDPYAGWGTRLVVLGLSLLCIAVVLALVNVWLLYRWWKDQH